MSILHAAALFLASPSPSVGFPSPGASPSASASSAPSNFGAGVVTFSFLLSVLVWVPLLVAVVVAIMPEPRQRNQRRLLGIAFWTNLFLLGLTLIVYSSQFSVFGSGVQFEEKMPWMPLIGASYHLGVTGVGMAMLVLSGVVGVVACLAAFDLRDRARPFFVLLLVSQGLVNGAIAAQDLLLLVMFWGAATVPLALLVGGWGSTRRRRAAVALTGYWSLGTAALLVGGGLLAWGNGLHSLELSDLTQLSPDWRMQIAIAALILVAAASRLPLVPLHGWAREALAEAHPAVAIVLAGAASRLGGDLLLRLYAGANHDGARMVARAVVVLAALTVVYAALSAFRTRDIRRMGAYLALIPGGITALGVGGLSPLSLDGAGVSLFAGGLAGALVVGATATFAYRADARSLHVAVGLAGRMPKMAWLLVAGVLAVLCVPFLATFPAVTMVLFGAVRSQPAATFAVVAGLAIAAVAVAWMLYRALFGAPNPDAPTPRDASMAETWYLGILVGVLLWVGVMPGGPKLAGNPIFDPGLVNVVTQATSDLSSSYAPSPQPTPTPTPSPSASAGAGPGPSPSGTP
jgi:NADH:ubiquinone oxidoreductase subunit 4 (subunit M)